MNIYLKDSIPEHLQPFFCPAELGLEDTPEQYIQRLVEVFREIRRVLREDGVAWLNLGDTYVTPMKGIGGDEGFSAGGSKRQHNRTQPKMSEPIQCRSGMSNLSDFLHSQLEGGVLFFGSTNPCRCATKRIHVLIDNKGSPDRVLMPFFTAQRITVKKGQDDLCEIGGGLDTPVTCWMSRTTRRTIPEYTYSEGCLNVSKDFHIIVTTTELDPNSSFKILPFPAKDSKTAFTIEVPREPEPKGISGSVPAFDTLTLNTSTEGFAEIQAVKDPIPFLDRVHFLPRLQRNFRIGPSSQDEVLLMLHNGTDLCFQGVRHLYLLSDGLTPYHKLLEEATHKFNETRLKQELGIPERVKRSLMQDGWICRQTVIWNKNNPMPESVFDRCTRSHEYIFMLTKAERYYYDHEAIKEQAVSERGLRNKRSVWNINTKPYPGAHFATWPEDLVAVMVKAGTSEKGCCSACGAPISRMVTRMPKGRVRKGSSTGIMVGKEGPSGWRPSCSCASPERNRCVVLDPFSGSATTGVVALRLGRDYIGLDLNDDYLPLAEARLSGMPAPGKNGSAEDAIKELFG